MIVETATAGGRGAGRRGRGGSAGCAGAVVLAAGFAEGTGAGTAAHQELVAAARAHELPVCGPNGDGIVRGPARVAL